MGGCQVYVSSCQVLVLVLVFVQVLVLGQVLVKYCVPFGGRVGGKVISYFTIIL